MALLGAAAPAVAWRHSGLKGQFSLAEPGGLLLVFGAGLLPAGLVVTGVHPDRRHDRALPEDALVEVFGAPPDELRLEGDGLSPSRGTAVYGVKPYRTQVRPAGLPTTEFAGTRKRAVQRYEVTAAPER